MSSQRIHCRGNLRRTAPRSGLHPKILPILFLASALMGGCGNHPNAASTPAPPANLNSDQAIFEMAELNGGESTLVYTLPYNGGAFGSSDFVVSDSTGGLTASPSTNGPQTVNQTQTLLGQTGAIPAGAAGPTWALQSGSIQTSLPTSKTVVSYQSSGIQVDHYSQDGSTKLFSNAFSNLTFTPLSGVMSQSPTALLASVPITNWITLDDFSPSATWLAGSGYITRKEIRVGDSYFVTNCVQPSTTEPLPTEPLACPSNGELTGIFPYSFLSTSDHPVETDFLADGSIATVQGLQMWIANTPLPPGLSATPAFRIFFALNGAVYSGELIRDGSSFSLSEASGNVVDYQVTLNQAAVNSIAAGLITTGAPGSEMGTAAPVPYKDLFGLGGTGVNGALSPADLRSHYNVPAGLTGQGQTIGIIDIAEQGDVAADLNTYSSYYNLPLCSGSSSCLQIVDLTNGTEGTVAAKADAETALDVEMVHAIAPAASIVLVVAKTKNMTDVLAAAGYAASLPGMTAVSISYSYSEAATEASLDSTFQAHPGVVFFSSSGDGGHGAQYPAASPYVTAVGGTRIQSIAWSGAVAETAWEFSGGGYSGYEPMPSWQATYLAGSPMAAANMGMRAIPDVAAVADQNFSPVSIYWEQKWAGEGGTSVATPIWAGLAALFGEYLANKGESLATLLRSTAGGFNGLLYQMQLSQGPDDGFYDIVSGSNNLTASACAICTAGAGFDDITGLGSPDFTVFLTHF